LWLTIKNLFVSKLHISAFKTKLVDKRALLKGLFGLGRVYYQFFIYKARAGTRTNIFNILELHPIAQPGNILHSIPKFHQETQENQHLRTVNGDDK
jgi:hypothetical protein